MKLNGPKKSVKRSLKTWDFLQTGIQLVMDSLTYLKGLLGKIQKGAAVEHNLGLLKVSLQFLEFYLCYSLLEALLRQGVKPNRLLVCS